MAEGKMVTFRLNADEADELQRTAGDEGLGVVAKRLALECVRGERIKVVQRPVSPSGGQRHKPWPGVRHAAICPTCQTREFVATAAMARAWRCPEHEIGMVQENTPYFAQSTA